MLVCVSALALPHSHAASAPSCLRPATWTTLEQTPARTVAAADLMADMVKRDVVLLGEYHDEDDYHRWQAQTLSMLHLLRPNMVIGFEMFPRRVQAALDRWVAGELTIKQFMEQSEWSKVWNTPLELYLPLFQFARINRIPMIALNVDSELNKAIRAKGWDAVPESQREGVTKPAPPTEAYRDFLFEVYAQHASAHGAHGAHGAKESKEAKTGKPRKSDSGFRYFVESQTTWDRAMAEALARPVQSAKAADKLLVVGIMGSGHIRFDHGVPHQLRDLGIKNVGSLLAMSHDADCKEIRNGLADAVFALPPQVMEKPEPPRLGIQMEELEGTVRIVNVTAGSLAEKSGLKAGDRLLEIGGMAVTATTPVIASVRRQQAGAWLPMQVKRGDETLDIVVKFPVSR